MATDPEARTQLARLLRDESLRSATTDALHEAVDARFELVVDGLVAEAAASDDVLDRDSAMSFVRLRLETLESVLLESQVSRLVEAVQGKIEAW
jgi:hypothetical protein